MKYMDSFNYLAVRKLAIFPNLINFIKTHGEDIRTIKIIIWILSYFFVLLSY